MYVHGLEIIPYLGGNNPLIDQFLPPGDESIEQVILELGEDAVFHTIGAAGTGKEDLTQTLAGVDIAI
jgi:hypothetical protein